MLDEIRILFIEDRPEDVAAVSHELRRAGLAFHSKPVDSKAVFLHELEHDRPDVILSDHCLPSFDAFTALAVARRICPEVPFIFVTGSLDEEMASQMFESGATDCVLMSDLFRLAPAVRRAVRETKEHAQLKRQEQSLRERTTELETANRELEAFNYSVSHDLRAPLRSIAGYVEILQNEAKLDESSREYLGAIANAARNMSLLIDALLDFSRMERAEMHVQGVSLAALVQEAQCDLRQEFAGRKVEWKIGELPEVKGDPVMLRLVFVNLLSNALKYTRTQPKAVIEVGADVSGGQTVVFVRDNGVGFDIKRADKLFGVFERLHPVHEFEGAGIGLANVRRIIDRHGGRTWAEGDVNRGATFSFSLPNRSK